MNTNVYIDDKDNLSKNEQSVEIIYSPINNNINNDFKKTEIDKEESNKIKHLVNELHNIKNNLFGNCPFSNYIHFYEIYNNLKYITLYNIYIKEKNKEIYRNTEMLIEGCKRIFTNLDKNFPNIILLRTDNIFNKFTNIFKYISNKDYEYENLYSNHEDTFIKLDEMKSIPSSWKNLPSNETDQNSVYKNKDKKKKKKHNVVVNIKNSEVYKKLINESSNDQMASYYNNVYYYNNMIPLAPPYELSKLHIFNILNYREIIKTIFDKNKKKSVQYKNPKKEKYSQKFQKVTKHIDNDIHNSTPQYEVIDKDIFNSNDVTNYFRANIKNDETVHGGVHIKLNEISLDDTNKIFQKEREKEKEVSSCIKCFSNS
ncbi:hypothetical protein Py17XNL_000801699 [Plasmodium yoelii yoelii]|uniref:Uncharacterized protein n=1 Tax=Plasmodium yoelii yoelii TaxID=73239 RepID=A0AAE9WQK6_PLAYO|nr:hypothetical protein Py17XNL_000801699 [Plasmodium yoelii yoelii]